MRSQVVKTQACLFGATLACVLAGCAASPPQLQKIGARPITPEQEVLTAALYVHFPYLRTLRRAESGNLSALRELIEFSVHTDAAASLAHGWVLLELRDIIGREAFQKAITAASARACERTLSLIEVAGTYEPYASADLDLQLLHCASH
jgi:hypothetical protein